MVLANPDTRGAQSGVKCESSFPGKVGARRGGRGHEKLVPLAQPGVGTHRTVGRTEDVEARNGALERRRRAGKAPARPAAFGAAFRRVSRPDLIHRFGQAGGADPRPAAEQFLRRERQKRARRRSKRVAAAIVLIVAAALAVRKYAERGRKDPATAPVPAAGR